SISTAASSVGYVGRMNSADTAGKAATMPSGETPATTASGMSAFDVAACEYRSAAAKTRMTASSHVLSRRRSPDAVRIASSCALTNVVPSHATPSTQIAADMPDLNVDAPRISEVCTLQTMTM